ncbi:MAG: hypothetical protein WCI63_04440 [bacterium]
MILNKKILIVLIIVLTISILSLAIYRYVYTKYYTDGVCGGFVGRVCSEGYYCKGATQQNEGSGTCVRE